MAEICGNRGGIATRQQLAVENGVGPGCAAHEEGSGQSLPDGRHKSWNIAGVAHASFSLRDHCTATANQRQEEARCGECDGETEQDLQQLLEALADIAERERETGCNDDQDGDDVRDLDHGVDGRRWLRVRPR